MDQEIIIKLLLSALWGAIIGAEREYHSKSAGFRTMILISISACILTVLSNEIAGPNNTDRITANILTGIGFLGAGVIFRNDNKVNGITTAATIWAVATLGIAIGSGNFMLALYGGLLIIIILSIMPRIERLIGKYNQLINYRIEFNPDMIDAAMIEKIFIENKLRFQLQSQAKEGKQVIITWSVSGSSKHHVQCSYILMEHKSIKRIETY